MRAIKVTLPLDYADRVKDIAFRSGVSGVNVAIVKYFSRSGKEEEKASVSFEASTPKAKVFVDEILLAEFFDPETCSLSSRERRAIVGSEPLEEITYPWGAPGVDVVEELYLFSHVTLSLVGRVFLAGCLLAYGLMHQNLLLMIAGMMFLPLLPIMSGVGFSAWIRQWNFTLRASAALILCLVLLFLSGAVVGALTEPPIRFNEFSAPYVSAIVSIVVGVAAGLGMTDDGGRRELIGLAATAQIAIIPSWLGIALVQGLPATSNAADVEKRMLTLFLNIACVIIGALVVYVSTRTALPRLSKLRSRASAPA